MYNLTHHKIGTPEPVHKKLVTVGKVTTQCAKFGIIQPKGTFGGRAFRKLA